MSESYCLTVKDVYGAPLSDLRVPEGWEFTGEFRPPLRGETYLGRTRGCWDMAITDRPRLILKKAPTVESVYMGQSMEQLKQMAQELEGFKWTGVFRKVKDGDYILGAAGGNSVVPVVNRPDLIGKWRVIMEKVPTIKEIYGKELKDLRAPDGWRFTGEFREPVGQDCFLTPGGCLLQPPYTCPRPAAGPRLILEKLPATPTIRDVYGTDEPEIPVGWRVKEFRQVGREEEVSYLGADTIPALKLVYGNVNYWYQRGFRLVLEENPNDPRLLREMKCTLTVTDVYGPVLPPIPEGWKVVGFRIPKAGEDYLNPNIGTRTKAGSWTGYPPVLILAPR